LILIDPSRPGDGRLAERCGDEEHGADEGELAQLDADVEGEERTGNGQEEGRDDVRPSRRNSAGGTC